MQNKINTSVPSFLNKSIFFAPVWSDNYEKLVRALKKDSRFCCLSKKDAPQYMLPYIYRIYRDDQLFMKFELKSEFLPRLGMCEAQDENGAKAVLKQVIFSCFSTGCILVEFHVAYEGLTLEEIENFSFHFKSAKKGRDEMLGTVTMEEAVRALLPAHVNAEIFFTGSDFKKECKMFHQICLDKVMPEDEIRRHIVHLRRGYHQNFAIPKMSGEYDIIYEPYSYDRWGGSQEGIVNIFNYTGEESTDRFLRNYKPVHLDQNYWFLYIVLLNQRFSTIRYLDKISQMSKYRRKEKEKLSHKIFKLKTVFSFSVVSDDQLYQNLYSKLYELLDIDRLLADIHDNEEQVEMLQNHEILESEKRTSAFLFGLSFLSLFSVLVDAAGYFDRIAFLEKIATPLSFCCSILIIVIYVIWRVYYHFK